MDEPTPTPITPSPDKQRPLVKWAIRVGLVLLGSLIAALWSWIGLPGSPPAIPIPVPIQEQPNVQQHEPEQAFYCRNTQSLADQASIRPWPVEIRERMTWSVRSTDRSFKGLTDQQVIEAFRVAWAAWGDVIEIKPVYVEDESKAVVRIRFGPLILEDGSVDGPGNVLAWSHLADGTTTPKHQLYDRTEKWDNSHPMKQIDLVRVACHEIGHVLGLTHDDEKENALMRPVIDRNIRFPTERDIVRLRALGYAPKVTPQTPNPSAKISLTFDAEEVAKAMRIAGYKVEFVKP